MLDKIVCMVYKMSLLFSAGISIHPKGGLYYNIVISALKLIVDKKLFCFCFFFTEKALFKGVFENMI